MAAQVASILENTDEGPHQNQQNPAPAKLSLFIGSSETFPYTFEG